MSGAAEFVGALFLARDVAHSVHLSTKSYARHIALFEFYKGVVKQADAFAEAYQGRYGLIGPIKFKTPAKTGNIITFLADQLEEIEKTRYDVCSKDDTPLQNLIDGIAGLYLSTLYKLRNLA